MDSRLRFKVPLEDTAKKKKEKVNICTKGFFFSLFIFFFFPFLIEYNTNYPYLKKYKLSANTGPQNTLRNENNPMTQKINVQPKKLKSDTNIERHTYNRSVRNNGLETMDTVELRRKSRRPLRFPLRRRHLRHWLRRRRGWSLVANLALGVL